MKQRIIFAVMIILVLVLTCFTSCEENNGASSINLEKEIIGEWEITKDSYSSYNDDYPASYLIFEANGNWYDELRGAYGGHDGAYFIEDNKITMSCGNWFSDYSYKISIENDILELQYKGYKPVYYERVEE